MGPIDDVVDLVAWSIMFMLFGWWLSLLLVDLAERRRERKRIKEVEFEARVERIVERVCSKEEKGGKL